MDSIPSFKLAGVRRKTCARISCFDLHMTIAYRGGKFKQTTEHANTIQATFLFTQIRIDCDHYLVLVFAFILFFSTLLLFFDGHEEEENCPL